MRMPILYSFIRFRPYMETGEFVNVGLFMCDVSNKQMLYKVVQKKDKRVNHFFFESHIFENVRNMMVEELSHTVNAINNKTFRTEKELINYFHNYVDDVKEGIFQYSDVAAALIEEAPVKYFDKLFNLYIKQKGIAHPSREEEIIKAYRKMFQGAQNPILKQYKSCIVKGDLSSYKLPLALESTNSILKAVKPLSFDQTTSANMVEHCDSWIARINRSSQENLINKNDILFTLDTAETKDKIKVLDTIKRTLDHYKINHTDWKNKNDVMSFASDVKAFS